MGRIEPAQRERTPQHYDMMENAEAGVRAGLLAELDALLERLLAVAGSAPSPTVPVDGEWTVHDTIGHILFWHASFARNVDDLVAGRRARPLKGRLADLNDRGVREARALPYGQVVDELHGAQATIRARILEPGLGLIPYRVGSRAYLPGEHLQVVRDHVRTHLRLLERALARGAAGGDPAPRGRAVPRGG